MSKENVANAPIFKIMVVEDEDGVRTLVTRLLTREGYEVVAAANGPEALDRLNQTRDVDLIVTDIVMPGMRGTDMVDIIRKERPEIPVLFITGYPQDDSFGSKQKERILFKPFSQKDLLWEVQDALEGTAE